MRVQQKIYFSTIIALALNRVRNYRQDLTHSIAECSKSLCHYYEHRIFVVLAESACKSCLKVCESPYGVQ